MKIEDADLSQLGKAKKIKVTKDSTVIIDGFSNQDILNSRIAQIKTKFLPLILIMIKRNYKKD